MRLSRVMVMRLTFSAVSDSRSHNVMDLPAEIICDCPQRAIQLRPPLPLFHFLYKKNPQIYQQSDSTVNTVTEEFNGRLYRWSLVRSSMDIIIYKSILIENLLPVIQVSE